MRIEFLGQGLQGESSAGSKLLEALQDARYSKFTAFIAFAATAGISSIKEAIIQSKRHIHEWNVFVGVDHQGTSQEALQMLLELDIGTTVYYTKSPVTFHPKIYLLEGESECLAIVGSSNLTGGGLFRNLEASTVIYVDGEEDEQGHTLIRQIRQYYASMLSGEDANVQRLTGDLIEELRDARIIPTERERRRLHSVKRQERSGVTNAAARRIDILFPAISSRQQPVQRKRPHPDQTQEDSGIVWGRKGRLLWKKQNLPQSDVIHTGTETTHVTGQLRLTQARFKMNNKVIDQTKYFRYELFGNGSWSVVRRNPLVESTHMAFRIRLLGEDIGEHDLEIGHKPTGEAGQGNFTTFIRWGKISEKIRERDLLGKTLNLYAPPEGEEEPFFIDIA